MSWSVEQLRRASIDELLRWARHPVGMLIQLHAIDELARRALQDTALMPEILALIGEYVGPSIRIGGLPVGYFGAKAFYDAGGPARQALMSLLATVDPLEREDLLLWLNPAPPRKDRRDAPPPVLMDELIFDSYIDSDTLRSTICELVGSPPAELDIEMARLEGRPAGKALVAMSPENWDELEIRGTPLSAALNTTVIWWPPEELGPLGPDLRVAVYPDGHRELVVAEYTTTGFDVKPYEGNP